jgi:hypothetical protein
MTRFLVTALTIGGLRYRISIKWHYIYINMVFTMTNIFLDPNWLFFDIVFFA